MSYGNLNTSSVIIFISLCFSLSFVVVFLLRLSFCRRKCVAIIEHIAIPHISLPKVDSEKANERMIFSIWSTFSQRRVIILSFSTITPCNSIQEICMLFGDFPVYLMDLNLTLIPKLYIAFNSGATENTINCQSVWLKPIITEGVVHRPLSFLSTAGHYPVDTFAAPCRRSHGVPLYYYWVLANNSPTQTDIWRTQKAQARRRRCISIGFALVSFHSCTANLERIEFSTLQQQSRKL